MVDKSVKQLTKWKTNSLFQVGHIVLIQSNLASKSNFQMHSFLFPTAILKDLDRTNRNFCWNKDPDSGAANQIGLNSICQPKCFGGLHYKKNWL